MSRLFTGEHTKENKIENKLKFLRNSGIKVFPSSYRLFIKPKIN